MIWQKKKAGRELLLAGPPGTDLENLFIIVNKALVLTLGCSGDDSGKRPASESLWMYSKRALDCHQGLHEAQGAESAFSFLPYGR
ncbi:hypothetical protein FRX31_033645 [Thalictrum thalictroides]|uniref:Uncharacterized protein n=1 Tax=Thalictrum thalictroides TaxID=46969 RepID=A0A7J6UWD7_THATH|nr:hypothetical protein FRX31_033645 [Thalictrum thalictroides]